MFAWLKSIKNREMFVRKKEKSDGLLCNISLKGRLEATKVWLDKRKMRIPWT